LVRDGGVESYDEPPGAPPREIRQPSALLGTQPPATTGPYGDPDAHAAIPAEPQGNATPPAPAPAPDDQKRTRRRRRLFGGLGILGTVAIVVAVVVSTVGSGSNAGGDAAVISAVNSSLANKTAQLTESVSISADGQTIAATGSGSVDFTTNEVQVALHVNIKGAEQDETAIYDAGVVYEQLPQVAQLIPGKSWVSLDLSALNAQSSSTTGPSSLGSNPIAELRLLALQGNTVSALGSSSVNGVPVQGYSVTVDPSTINSEIKSADLPDWMKQALSHVSATSAVYKVYVDNAGQLSRDSTSITETVSGTTVTVNQTADFSDYGAAVSISIPPASQVVPLTEFLQKGGQSSN
jgi:hypothetical protein